MSSMFPSSKKRSLFLLKLSSRNSGINCSNDFPINSSEVPGYLKNPAAVSDALVILRVWRDTNKQQFDVPKRSTFKSAFCKFSLVSCLDC